VKSAQNFSTYIQKCAIVTSTSIDTTCQLDVLLGAVKCTGSHYDFVLNIIRGLIEGTVDIFAFESELHKTLDSSAYMVFTVEKILQNIVRQVCHKAEMFHST